MFLWVPPVYLDQVRIFEYLNEKVFLASLLFSGQTECDTNSSDQAAVSVKTDSSRTDAQTNTVSSSAGETKGLYRGVKLCKLDLEMTTTKKRQKVTGWGNKSYERFICSQVDVPALCDILITGSRSLFGDS